MIIVPTLISRKSDPVTLRGAINGTNGDPSLPTHQVGDLLVVWLFGENSLPTVPDAGGTVPTWVTIHTASGSRYIRVAYAVATATNHTGGSWNNVQSFAAVFNGQGASPIGGQAASITAATTNPTAPAITLSNSTGTSAIIHAFFTVGGITWSNFPAGYTSRNSANTQRRILTKDDTTTDGAASLTASASQVFATSSIEIVAA